jgi:hypothetical protein
VDLSEKKPSTVLRVAAVLVFLTAIAIILPLQPRSASGAVNKAAWAGCREGLDFSSKRQLSSHERQTTCDYVVRVSEKSGDIELKLGAFFMRGRLLAEMGTTAAHTKQAHSDFTSIINTANGLTTPTKASLALSLAYAHRARLNVSDYKAPERALSDINEAIELTTATPNYYHFELRAIIFLSLAMRDEDATMVYSALDDLQKVKVLNPNSEVAVIYEALATGLLKELHHDVGQPVRKG